MEPVTISILGSEGTISGSLAYDMPVGLCGTRFGIGYDHSRASVIAGSFAGLSVDVESSGLNLSLSHPLLVQLERSTELRCRTNLKETKIFSSGMELFQTMLGTLSCGWSGQAVGTRSGGQYISLTQLDVTGSIAQLRAV